ncbi:MAG TPA: GH92 family glycosyl hydrolase [Candidatus Acidoferrales bacterium]|nr:GH92 family glycosyl hydrolase [Candidatus Acidoferrales bacterium]
MIPLLAAAVLAAAVNPTSLVDPFVGTSGTQIGGPIDTFPGADMPFGMIQWSPDTPSQNAGGGYEYTDTSITGFSLTHLSGPGCSVFGDFAMLPVVGTKQLNLSAAQPFAHAGEVAAPGYYAVSLGSPAIRAELTVTQRSGLGSFTFPPSTQAFVMVNAASNQAGVTDATARIVGPNEIEGSASSGFFCGMPDRYTVYFVARFDRAFAEANTFNNGSGPHAGAWARFDTTSDPIVRVQVAISFVDMQGALNNLDAEAKSWDITTVRNAALAAWQRMLSRVEISGGTTTDQRQFYTALYHTMLHPNVISDVDGRYRGFDGMVHRVAPGHAEYANYSDWDIYRTEIPLIALLAPDRTSDMEQSLVDAFKQSGWLPRWPLVNQPSSVMGGDSVDPVIAGGYAFGARDFDVRTALRAMIKGATDTTSPPGYGWYLERPESAVYQQRGYIPNLYTTSVSPVPNGASETLEYALDDASISAFAHAIGDNAAYERFAPRASNWANVFDTQTGWIAPRDESGAFLDTPIGENGQSGFQEGNAAQYTWMVPQDLPGLIGGMGGDRAALAKLDAFFSQLNADQDKPYAWMGNEPSLGSPWTYLAAGEPWRAQAVVRAVMTTLYMDRPDGIPGNDDLGTMSAWYVWCAMGLYPQFPAMRELDIGSPLFPHIVVAAPDGLTIAIDAPSASDATPYVNALRVDGKATQRTWIALPLHGSVHLAFALASSPNRSWGSAADDAMPAFARNGRAFPASTPVRVTTSDPAVQLAPGLRNASAIITFHNTGATPESVTWRVQTQDGLSASPPAGSIALDPQASQSVSIVLASGESGLYDLRVTGVDGHGAPFQPLTLDVRAQRGDERLPLAWIANRFDDTVMAYDTRTGALGAPIAVPDEPRDGVLTPDDRLYFVADRSAKAVSVIDTVRDTVVASVPVGNSPNGLAITPDGSTVWVANEDDGTIQPIDVRTLKAGKPLDVGTGPRYIAIAPDGSRLYVSVQGSNAVVPVALKPLAVLAPIAVGERPAGIALSPDGKTLYAVNNGDNTVSVVALASGATTKTVAVGVEPMYIAVDPAGKLAYVSNYATTTVTPVDLTTDTAGPGVEVGGQPFDVEWLHDGSAAFVILHRDNALVRIDRKGHASPPLFLGSGGAYTISLPH